MAHAHCSQPDISKINVECHKCQEKLRRFLSKFQGTYSVKFDAESGRLTVESTADKQVFKEAVGLVCEDTLPQPHLHNGMQHNASRSHNSNVAAAGNGYGGAQEGLEIIRWAQMAELQKLPNFHKLRKLELTQSGVNRRIKLTFFNDHKMDGQDQQIHIVKDDEPHGGGSCSNVNNIGPSANTAIPKNKTCCSSNHGDHQGGEGCSSMSTCDGGSNNHNFEFQYVHTSDGVPTAATGNNIGSHTYLIPNCREPSVTVKHVTVGCEDVIASKCTIL
ncbi:hypothetical protein CerSpe_294620 [Prunus speciosa]